MMDGIPTHREEFPTSLERWIFEDLSSDHEQSPATEKRSQDNLIRHVEPLRTNAAKVILLVRPNQGNYFLTRS
jgi:hypothetical protein